VRTFQPGFTSCRISKWKYLYILFSYISSTVHVYSTFQSRTKPPLLASFKCLLLPVCLGLVGRFYLVSVLKTISVTTCHFFMNFVTKTKIHSSLIHWDIVFARSNFQYDRWFVVCPCAEEHYKLRLPPYNLSAGVCHFSRSVWNRQNEQNTTVLAVFSFPQWDTIIKK